AAVHRQCGHDHFQGKGKIGTAVDAARRGDLSRPPLPVRNAVFQKPEYRLLLLVVGHPPLGGRGMGDSNCGHHGLHHHGGDRSRAEGSGEMALCGNRAVASSAPATITTGSALPITGFGGAGYSAPWSPCPSCSWWWIPGCMCGKGRTRSSIRSFGPTSSDLPSITWSARVSGDSCTPCRRSTIIPTAARSPSPTVTWPSSAPMGSST